MGGIRWRVVLHRSSWGVVALVCALVSAGYVSIAAAHPEALGNDAGLYFRATAEWLDGGDPWTVSRGGTTFGAIPPTLLVSVPLQPFGEEFARWFWPVTGALSMVLIVRSYRLSPLWLLWPPFLEGEFRGAVDYTLLGLVLMGGGAVAVLAKPYSAPALLSQGRRRALIVAGLAALVTVPLVPWRTFVTNWPAIEATVTPQSSNLSAWGSPLLMIATWIALISLRRAGLELFTPGLWPHSQMHYAIFSIRVAATSPILALGLALPFSGAPPLAIIIYAISLPTFARFSPVAAEPPGSRDPAG